MKDDFINFNVGTCDVLSAVRLILTWYWGDDRISRKRMKNTSNIDVGLIPGLKLSEQFCNGKISEFTLNDWQIFWEAFDTFCSKDQEFELTLAQLYYRAKDGYELALKTEEEKMENEESKINNRKEII